MFIAVMATRHSTYLFYFTLIGKDILILFSDISSSSEEVQSPRRKVLKNKECFFLEIKICNAYLILNI